MATVDFGDWTSLNWSSPSKDKSQITVDEITDIEDTVPQARRTSIGQEANLAYRRLSIGAETRVPTYHEDSNAKYCLPNDFAEHIRLETQALHMSEMMSNKVLHAPIETSATGLRLLDIGCGTGIVTDLMSSTFPHAECIGLDVSKVPKIRAHNSNVKFFQGNVMGQKPTEWIGEEKKRLEKDEELFDYLFSRLLILGMSDWPSFLKKEYELLKPGGWVEVQDLAWDWFSPDGVAISDEWEWLRWLSDHFETKKGIDVHCGNKAEKWMKDAGFEDVQVIKYVFPFCGSSESTLEMREFGRFNAEAVPVMLHHAIEKAVIDGESPVTEELHRKIEEMRSEMKRTLVPGKGMYQIFSVAIGRKPE